MNNTIRPVVVVGGVRIPFCRSNSAYSDLSNKDMFVTVLNGLVDKFNLKGEKIDEVLSGAVINHPGEWNFAREAVLSTSLSPLTSGCLLYTSPSPRDGLLSRMPSSA